MRAATPSGPGPTCRLCWMYLFGLTYANGAGSLVSSDFRRSMTCCLRLGAMGPPAQSLSICNNGPFGPLFASLAVALSDNDSLAGLIVTFCIGICLEQNLGPDRARITKKIDAFMRLIRAME